MQIWNAQKIRDTPLKFSLNSGKWDEGSLLQRSEERGRETSDTMELSSQLLQHASKDKEGWGKQCVSLCVRLSVVCNVMCVCVCVMYYVCVCVCVAYRLKEIKKIDN